MPKADSRLTVIKIGGSLLEKGGFNSLIPHIARFLKRNRAVIVHGGGREITAWAKRLGIKSRFVGGRRYTDDKLMGIVEMVLCGDVNPTFVRALNSSEVNAMGFSGRDGMLIQAKPVTGLGRVGIPITEKIKTGLIRMFLAKGIVPVFASVASGSNGKALNINADEMAASLAVALKARRLILFTDVPGILDKSKRTIRHISPETGRDLIRNGTVFGGMIPKVKSAFTALKKGVKEIWILEGKLPLSRARGTLISQNAAGASHPFS